MSTKFHLFILFEVSLFLGILFHDSHEIHMSAINRATTKDTTHSCILSCYLFSCSCVSFIVLVYIYIYADCLCRCLCLCLRPRKTIYGCMFLYMSVYINIFLPACLSIHHISQHLHCENVHNACWCHLFSEHFQSFRAFVHVSVFATSSLLHAVSHSDHVTGPCENVVCY